MHLGVQGKAVVLQPFDDMALPERAGKIEGVGVQAGYQDAQFPFTARAGQGRVADVVVQVDVLIGFPGRRQHPAQQAGPGKLVAPRGRDVAGFFHTGDHVPKKGFRGALRQRKNLQIAHVHRGVF